MIWIDCELIMEVWIRFYEDGLKMVGLIWFNMICETPVMGFFEWV